MGGTDPLPLAAFRPRGLITSGLSGVAVEGSLAGSGEGVAQGPDGRVLNPQGRAHQQQHCLPGALHPPMSSGAAPSR